MISNGKNLLKNYNKLRSKEIWMQLFPGILVFILCVINPVFGAIAGMLWFIFVELVKLKLFIMAKSGITVKDLEDEE